MSLEEMVGRQLVFGVRGPDVTDADLRLFEETRAGGLILYRRNFEGPERLVAMLTRLESALGRRLLLVRYAELESLWMGETPKNVAAIFRMRSESGLETLSYSSGHTA